MNHDISLIARVELRESIRDGRLRIALIAMLALLIVSLVAGVAEAERLRRTVEAADRADRTTFLEQGARNPHSVAHFGQFAFQPPTVLSFVDRGVTDYTGSALWLEAHYRNTAEFRPVEDSVELSRFASLSPAFILQVIVPLLIAVLAAGSIARERELGTLRLLTAQGVDRGRLFAGKLLGVGGVLAIVLVPAGLVAVAIFALTMAGPAVGGSGAMMLLGLAYAVYIATLVAIAIALSARARSTGAALLAFAAFWLVAVLLLPRVANELAARVHPVPDGDAFWASIREDIRGGIDAHGDAGAREQALEREVLRRYGVATLEELPVSFAGIALQASEEFGDLVYDRHYESLYGVHGRQEALQRAFAWLSPAIAMRDLSMALAGTDAWHQRQFAQAAEQHRRHIVRLLNEDMTQHAAGQDFDYLADPDLWARIPELRYEPPPLAETLRRHAGEMAALFLWLIGSMLLALRFVRRASPLQ